MEITLDTKLHIHVFIY